MDVCRGLKQANFYVEYDWSLGVTKSCLLVQQEMTIISSSLHRKWFVANWKEEWVNERVDWIMGMCVSSQQESCWMSRSLHIQASPLIHHLCDVCHGPFLLTTPLEWIIHEQSSKTIHSQHGRTLHFRELWDASSSKACYAFAIQARRAWSRELWGGHYDLGDKATAMYVGDVQVVANSSLLN